MYDLWKRIQEIFNKEKYVKTTKGRVGRVESHNSEVGTLSISFGRFDHNGDWIIKSTITISDTNVQAYLNKEECARELHNLHSSNNSNNSSN